VNEELSEFDLYGRTYKVQTGMATVEGRAGPEECRQTYSTTSGPIAATDGRMTLRLVPSPGGEPYAVNGFGITVIPGTTITLVCGGDPISSTAPIASQWLSFDIAPPLDGAEISADGQSIRGSTTHVDEISGTRTVAEWDLAAVAE
jgi:hypothetical protein